MNGTIMNAMWTTEANESRVTASRGFADARLLERVQDHITDEFFWLQKKQPRLLALAVNEAAALAWPTEFPQLLFPTLAEEKVRAAAKWHQRQKIVRQRKAAIAFPA